MKYMILFFVLLSAAASAQIQLNSRNIETHTCRDGMATTDKGCVGKRATVSWERPLQREDGSKLRYRAITAYNLTYTQGATVYEHTIPGAHRVHSRMLAPGNWHIEITATDAYGLTSVSAVVDQVVP